MIDFVMVRAVKVLPLAALLTVFILSGHIFFAGTATAVDDDEQEDVRVGQRRSRTLFLFDNNPLGFLFPDLCRESSSLDDSEDAKFETIQGVFVVLAFFRVLFLGELWGSCDVLCPDLCSTKPCQGFELSGDDGSTCTCINECSDFADCIYNEESYCMCKEGYEGDGITCVEVGRQNIIETFVAASIEEELPPTILYEDEDAFPFGSGGGGTYEATAKLELTKDGIVSLAANPSLVESVVCHANGTVDVIMDDAAVDTGVTMNELFPVGAILVVSAEVFGPCLLVPSGVVTIVNPLLSPANDGYLRIHERVGTTKESRLTGSVVSFMSMFDTASIWLRELNETNDRSVANLTARDESLEVKKTLDIAEGLKFETSLKATNRCYFKDYLFEKGSIGWQYEISMALDVDIDFTASLTFDAGLDFKYPDEELGQDPSKSTCVKICCDFILVFHSTALFS